MGWSEHIFIGLIPKYSSLYTYFSEAGFTLVFKEVVYQAGQGKPKGNCDTDLIVQVLEDFYEGVLKQAILVSSDGDYAPVVAKLLKHNSFHTIISPAPVKKCSILLKRTGAKISYIEDQHSILKKRSENDT